jgi:hypothetical protein
MYYTFWQRERKKTRHPPAAGAAKVNALELINSLLIVSSYSYA